MPLIPAFEIGVWNAWIFMLINFLPMPIVMRVHKGVFEDSLKSYGEAHKTVYYLEWVLWALAFVYSIFLPLRLGTIWFYIGLPIALVGVVTYIMVMVPFITTPLGKEPVTTGLYRYSRHPMYVTQLVMFIGVGIATASWLLLLLTIAYAVLSLIVFTTLCFGGILAQLAFLVASWASMPPKQRVVKTMNPNFTLDRKAG